MKTSGQHATMKAEKPNGRSRLTKRQQGLLMYLILLWVSPLSHAEWVEWIADADAGILFNDNINRSGFNNDVEDDSSLKASVSLGRVNQVNSTLRYSLTADFSKEHFNEYQLLNSQSAGASATIRKKLGLGLTVPWIKGGIKVSYLDVRDDVRSGHNINLNLAAGKRYSERLDIALALQFNTRDGKSAASAASGIGGSVFDQNNWEATLRSSYLLTERWLGSLGISYFDGEVDSACTGANVATVLANEKVKGIIADQVFGGCVYRIEASAYSYALDASYALDRHSSLNFGYRYQSADSSYQEYNNTFYNLSYQYSY